jgi:serine/threonine protein kinase
MRGMTEGLDLLGATIAAKYRIRRLVGVGGMGSVYEGEHVELGKRVAVKIIDPACGMSRELTARFKREARAASAVESEHIVQVFDAGADPDVGLFIVMEYLVGEDLEQRLAREEGGRLDAAIAAEIAYQTAHALMKAHASRVIHRDLKPANIFLSEGEDGALRVKVLDFGISKLLASDTSSASRSGTFALTQEGVAIGTPQYMSPEQARGLATVDHRTDIWSLGAVLYEAVAGRPAYPELASHGDVMLTILREPPPPLALVAPWVAPSLSAVIHDALEHDVARRIPNGRVFADRLAEVLPGVFRVARGGASQSAMLEMGATRATRADAGPDTLRDDPHDRVPNVPERAPTTERDPPRIFARNEIAPASFEPTYCDADAPRGRPSTLQTAVRSLSLPPLQSKETVAAALTALAVIVFGTALILGTRAVFGSSPEGSSETVPAAAVSTLPAADDAIAPSLAEPAPPPTGTDAVTAPAVARGRSRSTPTAPVDAALAKGRVVP